MFMLEAKSEYSKERYNQVNAYDISSKNFYSFAKECFSQTKDNMIPPIIAEKGQLIVEDQAKATYFNKFFATSSARDESNSTLPSTSVSNARALNFSIEDFEVSDQIKMLNINKSYGHDGILPRFIKMSGQSLVKPLTKLFNMSLQQGILPSS